MGLGLRPGAKAPAQPPMPYRLRASPRLYPHRERPRPLRRLRLGLHELDWIALAKSVERRRPAVAVVLGEIERVAWAAAPAPWIPRPPGHDPAGRRVQPMNVGRASYDDLLDAPQQQPPGPPLGIQVRAQDGTRRTASRGPVGTRRDLSTMALTRIPEGLRRQGVRRRIQERHDVRQGHRPKAVNLASDRRDEGIEISDAGRPRQLLRQPYPTGIMYSHHQDTGRGSTSSACTVCGPTGRSRCSSPSRRRSPCRNASSASPVASARSRPAATALRMMARSAATGWPRRPACSASARRSDSAASVSGRGSGGGRGIAVVARPCASRSTGFAGAAGRDGQVSAALAPVESRHRDPAGGDQVSYERTAATSGGFLPSVEREVLGAGGRPPRNRGRGVSD